jgi:hypothetical protein
VGDSVGVDVVSTSFGVSMGVAVVGVAVVGVAVVGVAVVGVAMVNIAVVGVAVVGVNVQSHNSQNTKRVSAAILVPSGNTSSLQTRGCL